MDEARGAPRRRAGRARDRRRAPPGAADAAHAHTSSVPGARFAYVTRRAGDRGALGPGCTPRSFRAASIADDGPRATVGPALRPSEPGRDSKAILEACASVRSTSSTLVGVDPLRDFPDATLARRRGRTCRSRSCSRSSSATLAPFADAFLPGAAFLEKDGHVTTWEGRGQRLRRVRDPEGLSLPDWEIFASLALACGGDLGFETLDELHEEMGHAPALRGRGRSRSVALAEPNEKAREGLLALSTYPMLVDEGRLSERADELKAALAATALHRDPSRTTRRGQRRRRGGRGVATAAGEATLPTRVTAHVAKGAVFVPLQPGRVRREPAARRAVRRSPHGRARGRRHVGRGGRGRRGRYRVDGLARLAPAGRPGRDRLLRVADLRDALHLVRAQGDRGHPDAEGPDARRAARDADHPRRRDQAPSSRKASSRRTPIGAST